MREIKFRAWLHKDGVMVYSDSSNEQEREEFMVDTTIHFLTDQVFDHCYNGEHVQKNRFCEYENAPIMQYTGLKDKNGKEIYEGDVFETLSRDNKTQMQGEVFFEDGSFKIRYGYQSATKDQRKDYFLSCVISSQTANWLEIIGNIYESPELLEAVNNG